MNSKSTEVQEILAERLNNLCRFLDEEYEINVGGCCYIAYCLAKLLSKDKFKFRVIVYEDYELEDKFSEISESHYHYAIGIGNYTINPAECDEDFCKNIYYIYLVYVIMYILSILFPFSSLVYVMTIFKSSTNL